jgi:hypothetical protein
MDTAPVRLYAPSNVIAASVADASPSGSTTHFTNPSSVDFNSSTARASVVVFDSKSSSNPPLKASKRARDLSAAFVDVDAQLCSSARTTASASVILPAFSTPAFDADDGRRRRDGPTEFWRARWLRNCSTVCHMDEAPLTLTAYIDTLRRHRRGSTRTKTAVKLINSHGFKRIDDFADVWDFDKRRRRGEFV